MALPQGIAVVTGAASGMGEAAARLLAEAGWSELLLCDLNAERLAATAQRIDGQAETLAGDIAAPGIRARGPRVAARVDQGLDESRRNANR